MSNSDLSFMTRDWIIKDKTAVEAGYVNDPNDLGGETNHGITKGVAQEYKVQLVTLFKWDGSMKNLTKEMAYYIYKVGYWDKLKLDTIFQINKLLADKLFDIGINIGISTASMWLQVILNSFNRQGKLYPDIATSGGIGPQTLGALDAFIKTRGKKALQRLHLALFCMQGQHYISISVSRQKNEEFTFGWYDRMEHNLEYYSELWEQ
jgi:lysozyme family protein